MGGKGTKVKEPQQQQQQKGNNDVYISFDTMPTLYIDRKMKEMQLEQQQQQQFGYNMQQMPMHTPPATPVYPVIAAKYQPSSQISLPPPQPVSFVATQYIPMAPSPATFQPIHKIRSRSLPHLSAARQTPWPIMQQTEPQQFIMPQQSYIIQPPLQSIPEIATFQPITMLPSRAQTTTQIMHLPSRATTFTQVMPLPSRVSTQIIPLPQPQPQPQQQQPSFVVNHIHKRLNKLRSRSHGSSSHHIRRNSHRANLPRIGDLPENATIISDKIYMLPIDQQQQQQQQQQQPPLSFFKSRNRLIRPLGMIPYNNSRRTSIETQTTRTLTEHLSVSENEAARNKNRRLRRKEKNHKKSSKQKEESESNNEMYQRIESTPEKNDTDTSSVVQNLRSRLHSNDENEGRN